MPERVHREQLHNASSRQRYGYYLHLPRAAKRGRFDLGDAVHNLRSALDHLTWELDAAEEDRDPRLQFPVGKDRREFAKACRQVQSRTGRAALKALEAFPGGDGEALHSLSVLDNEDKHRRLSAVAQVPGVSNLRLVKDGTELRSLAEVFPGGMFAPGGLSQSMARLRIVTYSSETMRAHSPTSSSTGPRALPRSRCY